ncbi:MAG: MFS transporter [Proteobacteria bacterium]|nr:MFS transporter [Pseudomonadota bacterium]
MSMLLPTTGALWRHSGFMRLWAAQTVSSFGARIAREGFGIAAILTIDAQPAQLGILAALTLAPGVVVGLFAGGFVDRTSRRRIMVGSDLFRAVTLATIPLAAWMHWLEIEQLYVCAFLVGCANILFNIADHAFLPSLVARGDLVEGNTKLGITESIAEIGGPALAGLMFQFFTAPFAMLGTALTYVLSAGFLFCIGAKERDGAEAAHKENWLSDIGAGFGAVLGQPLIRPIFFVAVLSPLFGSFFAALYSIYCLKILGFTPAVLGLTIAMGGLGSLFGAALSSRLCRIFGVGRAIVLCLAVSALLALLIPLAGGPFWLRVAMMMTTQFGGDAFAVAMMIPMTSLRQSLFPARLLGRTAAAFTVSAGAVAVIGALVGGVLGDRIGVRPTLYIAAALYFATPFIVAFSPLRELRQVPFEKDAADVEPIDFH